MTSVNPENLDAAVHTFSVNPSDAPFINRKGFGYSPRLNSAKLPNGSRKVVLPMIMERPEGTHYLGSLDTQVPTYLGKEYMPIKMCFDSGSSITLISAKSYQALKSPPRLKQGHKLKLKGV